MRYSTNNFSSAVRIQLITTIQTETNLSETRTFHGKQFSLNIKTILKITRFSSVYSFSSHFFVSDTAEQINLLVPDPSPVWPPETNSLISSTSSGVSSTPLSRSIHSTFSVVVTTLTFVSPSSVYVSSAPVFVASSIILITTESPRHPVTSLSTILVLASMISSSPPNITTGSKSPLPVITSKPSWTHPLSISAIP